MKKISVFRESDEYVNTEIEQRANKPAAAL
jgi:hypothetical protein